MKTEKQIRDRRQRSLTFLKNIREKIMQNQKAGKKDNPHMEAMEEKYMGEIGALNWVLKGT